MGHAELMSELRTAGYDPALTTGEGGAEFVTFSYQVPVGARAGDQVRVGLQTVDWPLNPPGGPHISPRIHHPGDNAHHPSPLGSDWIYWSRPHPAWAETSRTLEEYLTHLRTLFSQFAEIAA